MKLENLVYIAQQSAYVDNRVSKGAIMPVSEESSSLECIPENESNNIAQQSAYVDNTVSKGAIMPVNEESSSLECIPENQSNISSPMSVLQSRKSYTDIETATHSQSQHLQPMELGCSGGLQSTGTTPLSREQSQGFISDQPEYSFGSYLSDDSEEDNPSKRPVKTRLISDILKQLDAELPAKKCLHCETTETPRWKTGPMGRNTLCNACGVQYKHGRLYPECRPSSPTFNPSLHSSLPKKVRWMKRGKRTERFPIHSTTPKKHKESIPEIYPSFSSGENVPQMRLSCTNERHPNNIHKSRRIENISLGSSSQDQSHAEKANKFQEMGEKAGDIRLAGCGDSNLNSKAMVTVRKKKPLKSMKKCLHCESTETPQWRTGPLGQNTLCNACGVQYRHGRLIPEYRPLNSPKYDPSLHSHSPKKVQKTRKRNEKCAHSPQL